jgi:predicted nuclease of predicted toxin-antitoxin system
LLLRKANKPNFGSGMLQYLVKANNNADDRVYVIDGGWLLRKLPWGKGLTYAQIYDLYKQYVLKHFNRSVVVFDSYPNRPTTKDSTHLRRSKYNCVDINVKPNNKCNVAAKSFFSNKVNKQAFIYQLASVLLNHNIKVLHADDDADLLIVKTAVQIAEREDVILVGEDNDLLALLCHYAQPKCKKLLFQTSKCTWDIIETQKAMCGLEKSVLLLHCFFGCDTTSQIFNISKDKVFKDIELQRTCHEVSAAFYAQDSCKEAISTVGDKIMIALYKKKEGKDLNKLRHKVFMDKVAGKKSVKPEQLPPTKDSSIQHYFRVYHQIQSWLGRKLDPLSWGWKLMEDKLLPVTTLRQAGPDYILKYVRCSCSALNCNTDRCSCRKHGLRCTMSCTKCNGVSFCNRVLADESVEDEEEA